MNTSKLKKFLILVISGRLGLPRKNSDQETVIKPLLSRFNTFSNALWKKHRFTFFILIIFFLWNAVTLSWTETALKTKTLNVPDPGAGGLVMAMMIGMFIIGALAFLFVVGLISLLIECWLNKKKTVTIDSQFNPLGLVLLAFGIPTVRLYWIVFTQLFFFIVQIFQSSLMLRN